MRKVKLALIGCGPHAKRIYLPALSALRETYHIELELVVELKGERESVEAAMKTNGFAPRILLIEPYDNNMPAHLKEQLSTLITHLGIQGVIISTEPLAHKAYAEWALECSLNILMDKPITSRANATSSLASADGLLHDYEQIMNLYTEIQTRNETIFMVNAQRRAHPGFLFVERLIKEVSQLTNCPVTSLQSYHCDGQWRLPSEIVTQKYHPYCQGYGKASHSGYHIFDIMYRIYLAGTTEKKRADTMEIVSSFIQPKGFIKQLTESDYGRLFGRNYEFVKRWSDSELKDIYANYGEIDLSGLITLKNNNDPIASFSVNLVHNGFSKRTWLMPGKDLYKGNGRVKHEHHNIQQGPFQNIQIHSYQSNDRHDSADEFEDGIGGNNHFDVHVFRNPMVSDDASALRIYKLADILSEMSSQRPSLLTSEASKHHLTRQFVSYLAGITTKSDILSQIDDHRTPVQIMSGLYRSHILRNRGMDCVVRIPLDLKYLSTEMHPTHNCAWLGT